MSGPSSSLVAFWFAQPPFDEAGSAERFGVTGHSYADALRILEWSGCRIRVPLLDLVVIPRILYSDLLTVPGFRAHVALNMGPMVVRGVWYPHITAAPPSFYTLARETR